MEFVLKNIVIYAQIVLIIFSLKNSDAQITYNVEAEQLLDLGRNLFYASSLRPNKKGM